MIFQVYYIVTCRLQETYDFEASMVNLNPLTSGVLVADGPTAFINSENTNSATNNRCPQRRVRTRIAITKSISPSGIEDLAIISNTNLEIKWASVIRTMCFQAS